MPKTLQTIGVIGGMGPEATLLFLNKLIQYTSANKDQDHLPVITYSNPQIPNRTHSILEKSLTPLQKHSNIPPLH